jgi:hypothetical protein
MDLIIFFATFVFALFGEVSGQSSCASTWYVLTIFMLHGCVTLNSSQGPMWWK